MAHARGPMTTDEQEQRGELVLPVCGLLPLSGCLSRLFRSVIARKAKDLSVVLLLSSMSNAR